MFYFVGGQQCAFMETSLNQSETGYFQVSYAITFLRFCVHVWNSYLKP